MDIFQKKIIFTLNKRENCSLRNHVTIWNSYHTEDDFTSAVRVHNKTIATVYYKLGQSDLSVNIHGGHNDDIKKMIAHDRWEVDYIEFDESAIRSTLGTQARRVANFLKNTFLDVNANPDYINVYC